MKIFIFSSLCGGKVYFAKTVFNYFEHIFPWRSATKSLRNTCSRKCSGDDNSFLGFYTGIIKLKTIDKISNFLLDNLAFFFLPAGVSLIISFVLLEGKWPAILGVSLLSTVITLGITGLTVQFVKKFLGKKQQIG